MALVSLNCPNCGGSLKMEDSMEKGFCMYCGTAFLVKDEIKRIQVEHRGTVIFNLNRETEVENLLIRAEQKIEEYKSQGYSINDIYPKMVNEYFEKALDINPRSDKVQEMKNRIISEQNDQIEKQIEEQKAADEAKMEKDGRILSIFTYVSMAVITIVTILLFISTNT